MGLTVQGESVLSSVHFLSTFEKPKLASRRPESAFREARGNVYIWPSTLWSLHEARQRQAQASWGPAQASKGPTQAP